MPPFYGVCDRCREPLDAHLANARGGPEASALLGDSYVLLPEKRRGALPDLSQTIADVSGAGAVLAAASMHEQLRTVTRLLNLSDQMHERTSLHAPSHSSSSFGGRRARHTLFVPVESSETFRTFNCNK